ncbi:MAG: Rieske 2Fe-2S domain-containing protein [Dehalococcoidia bacterium]|nr:Rieske 2Fe-2S domain-containing protein [Dehalococcoidia bacterium]
MSPALAFLGVSIIGTWGLASIGLIAAGIIMIFFPGDATIASGSDPTLAGIVLLVVGFVSMGLMGMTIQPLLGLDPPLPIRPKQWVPASKLTRWTKAGTLRDFPNNTPKEVRLLSRRVTLVRVDDNVYAMNALCSHARLPLAGLPGSPVKPMAIRDGCVTCPFHGAKFEVETGKLVREPFDSQWNNDHPFLGRLQSKLFFFNKSAYDQQTYPVKVEGGEIFVALPK